MGRYPTRQAAPRAVGPEMGGGNAAAGVGLAGRFRRFRGGAQGVLAKGEGMEGLYEIKGQGVRPRGWPAAWPWITTSSSY